MNYLINLIYFDIILEYSIIIKTLEGHEPPIFCLEGSCLIQLGHRVFDIFLYITDPIIYYSLFFTYIKRDFNDLYKVNI